MKNYYPSNPSKYNIGRMQDAGIRTRDAATAARCAINELHTFLNEIYRTIPVYFYCLLLKPTFPVMSRPQLKQRRRTAAAAAGPPVLVK